LTLSKFSYEGDLFPEIEGITLKDLNLLVCKNANGKSTILFYIHLIAKVLKGDIGATKYGDITDNFEITFQNSSQKLGYNLGRMFSREGLLITKEYLKHNDNWKVKRDNASWAENTYFIDFNATKLGDFRLESEQMKLYNRVKRREDSFMRYNDLVAYYYAQLSPQKRISIKETINTIGFHITEIDLDDYKEYTCPPPLRFSEIDKYVSIEDTLLSSGMKRTIYLIIYLEYLISKKNPTTLLIDNLGEGLDYERSYNLGKYVFERCKDSNVQLIAASNDNFLLDAIDLEYWTILNREGNKISAINMESHPEIFEKFNFIGLSNFSLLSSDFLERELQKQE